jgi:hypothetical protein
MSKQNGEPDRSLGQVTEALVELFARARELEALSPHDLAGVRMKQLVQIERGRMDFEHFRKMLVLEVSHLRRSLDEALAVAIEARRMVLSTRGAFEFPSQPAAVRHRQRT